MNSNKNNYFDSHGIQEQLLIVQPSPFCNLDCKYCYLPNRSQTHLMDFSTLQAALQNWIESPFVHRNVALVWHVGEPLTISINFYREAAKIIENVCAGKVNIHQSIQTNATLINDEWCEFFVANDVRLSVSIDGPEYLNDKNRIYRSGKGSYHKAMDGIRLLQKHNIPFYVISVVTRDSLNYADELFEWYLENNIRRVGFNPEEIEGINTESSLNGKQYVNLYKKFLKRFVELAAKEPNFELRETKHGIRRLLTNKEFEVFNQQNIPWGIISVDWRGDVSTFSPELISQKSKLYGNFIFGNVHVDTFEEMAANDKFARISADVARGVSMCEFECEYFNFCGGGAPSNKYFENGNFICSETLACKLSKKTVYDVLLEWLEREIEKKDGLHFNNTN